MINPLKVLLFLAGGTVVAAAGAYVSGALDPLFTDEPQAVATLPAEAGSGGEAAPADPAAPKEDRVEQTPGNGAPAAAEQPAADAAQPTAADEPVEQPSTVSEPAETPPAEQADNAAGPPAEDNATADEQKPADVAALDPQAPVTEAAPEAVAPAADATLPTFDVVRVETDGSMVIAGKASPDSKIELLAGDRVIGDTTADSSGDFVVVLDRPLAPGDYQITIRTTKPDGSSQESAQTAIVSIPSDPGGQVLAMIEEPGKPSEIIKVPQPTVAAADAAGGTEPDQVAAADPGEGGEQAVAADPARPSDGVAASDPAKPAQEGTSAEAEKPAEGDEATDQTQQPADGPEVATANPEPGAPADQPAAPSIDVAVEAVEIDGSKVFVAGRAPAGSTVRVYANDILLGDATASPAGRFLVEATQDLPVGNYVVRVDVLGSDGAEVIARAAVPFVREPGENIAAVAAPVENDPAGQKPAETEASEPAADAPAGEPAEIAEAAPPATDETPAQPPAEVTEEQAPGPDGEPATPTSVAEAPATEGQEASPADTGAQPPAPAEQAPPAAVAEDTTSDGDATPADVAGTPAPSVQPPAADQSAVPPETPDATPPSADTQAPASPEQPSPSATAEAQPGTAEPPAGGGGTEVAAAAPPAEVTAPPLQKVDSAVIIRRGDTLWRISKRVYGRGVRYSTIYLANQDQIRDPDFIWPGQVFTVPDKTTEGETADMSRMGGQVVPKTQ